MMPRPVVCYLLLLVSAFFLTPLPTFANEPSRETITQFSREGVSLGQGPEAARAALLANGFELARSRESQARDREVLTFNRKRDGETDRVTLTVEDGAIVSLGFNVQRVSKDAVLSDDAADAEFERLVDVLGLADHGCRVKKQKGGGQCSGKFASADYQNRVKLKVGRRALSIDLDSGPVPQEVKAANELFVSSVRPAYACYATSDVNDATAIYRCVQNSAQVFAELGNRRILRPSHRIIRPQAVGGSCSDLRNLYAISQRYATSEFVSQAQYESLIRRWREEGQMAAPDARLPSCETLAQVIEISTGNAPAWSNCTLTDSVDEAQFRRCVEGVSWPLAHPSLGMPLPSCERLLGAYIKGIGASLDGSEQGVESGLDCDKMTGWAKQWRGPLPDHLQPCDNFTPADVSGHMESCLTAVEPVFLYLTDCQSARQKYEQRLSLAHGGRPSDYVPLTCAEVEPLLAKAEALREQRRLEAEERQRAFEERQRQVAQAQREFVESLRQQMAEKYADSPEAVAARTSAREKTYRTTGNMPGDCPDPPENLYCPPTLEEIRLAMMRRHANKLGFDIVNGRMMHGRLATGLTVLGAIGGRPGIGMIGVELNYRDPQLIYRCAIDGQTGDRFVCVFRLPVSHAYDALTNYYMDGFTGSAGIDMKNFMFDLMDGASAADDHSYAFKVDENGLWQATPTTEQQLEDIKDRLDAIESRLY